jgi:hypothetical protein
MQMHYVGVMGHGVPPKGNKMINSRKGKTKQGSHEYVIADGITACQMGNDQWSLFRMENGRYIDTGIDCPTLAAARKYASDRNWPGSRKEGV